NRDAHLLAVTPANIRCHASDCIAALRRADHYPATIEDYQRWREFFEHRIASPSTKDYRIDLVHRDDVIAQFFHTSSFPTHIGAGVDGYAADEDVWRVALEKLSKRILELPNSWYWCVSGYSLQSGLQALWLFDSRSDLQD